MAATVQKQALAYGGESTPAGITIRTGIFCSACSIFPASRAKIFTIAGKWKFTFDSDAALMHAKGRWVSKVNFQLYASHGIGYRQQRPAIPAAYSWTAGQTSGPGTDEAVPSIPSGTREAG